MTFHLWTPIFHYLSIIHIFRFTFTRSLLKWLKKKINKINWKSIYHLILAWSLILIDHALVPSGLNLTEKALSKHRLLTCKLRYLNVIFCLILPRVWLLILLCWIPRCWHRKKQSCFNEKLQNFWYLCSFLSRLKLYKTCIMYIHSQNCQQC